jgi:ATP-dependent DNA ligase
VAAQKKPKGRVWAARGDRRRSRCHPPSVIHLLQNSANHEYSLVFYLFDLLILAGEDLRNQPLEVRRKLLQRRVMSQLAEPIPFSETIEVSAADLVRAVREQGLEGVIAKRRDSLYQAGKRSGAWIKMRVNQGQELVIGGYVPSAEELRLDRGRLL